MDCGSVRIPYPACWNGWFYNRDGAQETCEIPTEGDYDAFMFAFADPDSDLGVGVTIYEPRFPDGDHARREREFARRGAIQSTNGWYVDRGRVRQNLTVSPFGAEAHGDNISVYFSTEVPPYLEDSPSEEALIRGFEQMISEFMKTNSPADATLFEGESS
jgi:hypothetical protein